uniref:Uncharacterized protein n=1 Tax=Timema poppense TaxID=170557 RepID=A0A7R9H2J9_TIMPO|nr:unnamed protein product [Timema poppensis]
MVLIRDGVSDGYEGSRRGGVGGLLSRLPRALTSQPAALIEVHWFREATHHMCYSTQESDPNNVLVCFRRLRITCITLHRNILIAIFRYVSGELDLYVSKLDISSEFMENTVDRPKSRTFPDCIAVLEYIDKVLEFVLQPVPSCRRSMTPETEKVVFAVYDESLMDKNGTGCKILAVLVLISANSMFAMMLLEAVFLHRLIAAAFKAEPNMKILYCFAAGQIMFATVAATFRAPYFYISSKQTPVEADKLQVGFSRGDVVIVYVFISAN